MENMKEELGDMEDLESPTLLCYRLRRKENGRETMFKGNGWEFPTI